MDKVWGINVSNLCVLLKYFLKSETIRSQLLVIKYFISVIGIIDQLIGYLVNVHSTNMHTNYCRCS